MEKLEIINNILSMVKEFGVTIVVVGYFIFKDYKVSNINNTLLELMGRINNTLDKLEKFIVRSE